MTINSVQNSISIASTNRIEPPASNVKGTVLRLKETVIKNSSYLEPNGLNRRPLADFEVMKKKFSGNEINRLCRFILSNYDVKLRLPPGKLVLSKKKNELECGIKSFTKEHLIVLLYSMDGAKEDAVKSLATSADKDYLALVTLPRKIKKGDFPEINFFIKYHLYLRQDVKEKVDGIYELIAPLLKTVGAPIPIRIIISDNKGTHFFQDENICIITLNINELYADSIVHEIGHYIFVNYIVKDETLHAFWLMLYCMALGGYRYELVDESNYNLIDNNYGHPCDNENEFFASSLSTFLMHKDQMEDNMMTETDEKLKDICIAIEHFMRQYIMKNPLSFKVNGIEKIVDFASSSSHLFAESDITASLKEALFDCNPTVKKNAAEYLEIMMDK